MSEALSTQQPDSLTHLPVYPANPWRRVHLGTVAWVLLAGISAVGATGVLNEYHIIGWAVTLGISVAAVRGATIFMPLTLVLLFNTLFSFYAIPHVFFEVDVMTLPAHSGLPLLTQANWVVALFVSTLMAWVSSINTNTSPYRDFNGIVSALNLPNAPSIFYFGLLIIASATHFGITGSIVVGVEGGYSLYVENLQGASGLQEYLLVPFLVTGLLIRSRLQRILWYLVLVFFVIKLLSLGLRVVALMGVLVGFWFLDFRWTLRRFLLLFLLGYLLFSFFGLLKGNLSTDQLAASLFFELHGDSLVSHHGNVLWASSVMLGLINEGVVDFYVRAELSRYIIANSIIPSGVLQRLFDAPYFSSWLQEMGYTSGGGHAAVFAYVAGGTVGVVFLGSLLGWALRRSLSADSSALTGAVRCWVMLTMITFPRWLSYDIGNFLLRLPIYAATIFLMIVILGQIKRRADATHA